VRGACRTRVEPQPIDFGDDPPLSVDGRNASEIDRRRVSARWYAGTILTGLCGAALMGGAVYAALDGEAHFASLPERLEALRANLSGAERTGAGARKTDRLQMATETHTARQVVRISTTTKVGEREVMRMRPYVRIASNLSLTTSELSANIPPFNVARLLSGASASAAPAPEETPGPDDAEVSFVMRDLAPALPRAKIAGVLPLAEVMARVREAANWSLGSNRPVLASIDPNARLGYAVEGNVDPYAGFETRIVPENITLLPKTAAQVTGGNTWNERTVVVKKGDTAPWILRELGATLDEAKAIAAALGPRGKDGGLKEGQKLRVLLSPSGSAQRMQPIRIIVMGESTPEMVVALSDTGKYVSVDVQSAETTQVAETEDEEEDSGAVRLYQSIYETAMRQQVPRPLIDELVRIYSYDVDFQRKVQPGDSFELLYPGEDDPSGEGKGDVLFAALTVGGETKRYYRFQSPDDGVVDYYDETGKSAKKFLVRKPVDAGIMRSGYGWRRHPILGYSKMHTGVDWSAPRGTPIFASGNGVVDKVGWEGGYGKYVRLRHNQGYETAYGHMSAFARGVGPGARVRQGQVIGYVGSTGLSTGAHVHYEILVNGRFVDPNRIKLPRGRSLEGPVLANFERERDRFDGMMSGGVNANGNNGAGGVPVAEKTGGKQAGASKRAEAAGTARR
jgi:murein DD-endopeptidase MepM/ murein hydrolase activator NlpD